jgi:hypothetical protein
MSDDDVLFSVRGPLLAIGSRVTLVMGSGLVVLLALRIAALALRQCRAAPFCWLGWSGLSVLWRPGSALRACRFTASPRCWWVCRTR